MDTDREIKVCQVGHLLYIFEVEKSEHCLPISVMTQINQMCYIPVAGSVAYYTKENVMEMKVAQVNIRLAFPCSDCRKPSSMESLYYNDLPLV